MNLNFTSPIYLLGLLGIALPILVHLLTRRQQTHIKFSAIYLLLQSQERSIRRSTPNRMLLLLARTLGIVCLSMGLAGPLFSFGSSGDTLFGLPVAGVIVMDDSYSMGIQSGDQNLYVKALQAAEKLFKKASAENAFSLVYASAPGRAAHDWTTDTEMIAKKLNLSKPLYRTTDIGTAVAKALELLESAPQKTKRIYYLFTDLDKNGWKADGFTQKNPGNGSVSVKIVDLSPQQTGVNRATIKNIETFQEFLTSSKIIRVKATIVNLMPERAIQNLRVSLWINDKQESEDHINVPASGVAEKDFSFPSLSDEPVSGYVKIEEDALAADNRRYFTHQPERKIRALVVDGDPKTVTHQSESFYLERALNPFSGTMSDIEPTISTLKELPARNLLLYSIVILCNVRDLPFQYERELEKFMLRGGALFVALGDQIDPRFYNEKMGNLLPVKLESLIRLSGRDVPQRFQLSSLDHPVLSVFSGKILKEMEDIQFTAFYKVQPLEGKTANVAMRLDNGLPAVVESEFGKGKSILFVSSLDRDWNSFPIQPTFLPWIQRWTKYAVRNLGGVTPRNILVGQPFILGEEISDKTFVYIQTPERKIAVMTAGKNASETKFEDTYRPGIYEIFRSTTAPAPVANPVETEKSEKTIVLPADVERAGNFAVNVDTQESIHGKITKEEIAQLLPGFSIEIETDPFGSTSATDTPGIPLTTPLLLLVASAILLEGWMVRRE